MTLVPPSASQLNQSMLQPVYQVPFEPHAGVLPLYPAVLDVQGQPLHE